MSELRKLPKGWQWVKLGEIAIINPKRPHIDRNDDEPTTFIPMSAVDISGKITNPDVQPFNKVKKGYTYFEKGDVLFAKITPCMENGKHAIAENLIDDFGFGSTEFHVLKPSQKIISEWIYFFVRQSTVLNGATNYFKGAVGQQRVPKEYLMSLKISLPLLSEQKRLATLLTEKLAGVERARAAIEAQLEAAQALSGVYLREVFESEEANNWVKKTLAEICVDISDGTHFTPTYVEKGVPFLSVKDVKETKIYFDNCRYITKEEHLQLCKRCQPEKGDVLYTKVGTTGIAKAIDIDKEFSIFVSVALLKIKSDILPEYLELVLNAPICRTQAEFLTQGMANRNLVIKDLKLIKIPLPSISKQKGIINIAKEKLTLFRQLQKTLEEQLQAINLMPSAILRQAFNGEL
ncbi:MAG: hypothetical protein DRR19_18770 [Candidatus Parabeggiatoa sp. nov. 1]|nr:MAG: hypothetical protein DRR19_18770 [Gammaproteobacteria bacterium]